MRYHVSQKKKKDLKKVVNRPFEVVSGLPISRNPPTSDDYKSFFENPLSIKDSGVFYTSLIRSRQNYIYLCPMFSLFWVKNSSYLKKNANNKNMLKKINSDQIKIPSNRLPKISGDVNSREIMVKLCDASMSLGPHFFKIRLFIVKDERSLKTKFKTENKCDETLIKKDNQTNEQTNESDLNQISSRNNYTLSFNSGSDINSTFLFKKNINQINETQSSTNNVPNVVNQKLQNNLNENGCFFKSDRSNIMKNKKEGNEIISDELLQNQNENSKLYSEQCDNLLSKNRIFKNENNCGTSNDYTSNLDLETINSNEFLNSKYSQDFNIEDFYSKKNLNGVFLNNKLEDKTNNKLIYSDNENNHNEESLKTDKNEKNNGFKNIDPVIKKKNSIFSLENLTAKQKSTCQSFTVKSVDEKFKSLTNQCSHNESKINSEIKINKKKISMEKKEIKLKKTQNSTNEQRLTVFQEKYSTNATFLFEFVENPNVRFMIPKDSVYNILPSYSENETFSDQNDILISHIWIHNQNEINEYKKTTTDHNDFLTKTNEINFNQLLKDEKTNSENILETTDLDKNDILKKRTKNDHNLLNKDYVISNFDDQKSKVVNHKIENKTEIEIKNEENIQIPEELSNPQIESIKNEKNIKTFEELLNFQKNTNENHAKKKQNTVYKKDAKKLSIVEPKIKFTTFSFTIHSISKKFVPILANSFKPLKEVQDHMSNILKNGTRISPYFLWYRLDGRLDDNLAESLRFKLKEIEKKSHFLRNINSVKQNTSKSKNLNNKRKKNDDSKNENEKRKKIMNTPAINLKLK